MELQRRCNTLIMLIDKEMNEVEEMEKNERKMKTGVGQEERRTIRNNEEVDSESNAKKKTKA